MEGKIDRHGVLHIKRKSQWKTQYCMHQPDIIYAGEEVPAEINIVECSDDCPQFDEPDVDCNNITYLGICENKILAFTEFTDERE